MWCLRYGVMCGDVVCIVCSVLFIGGVLRGWVSYHKVATWAADGMSIAIPGVLVAMWPLSISKSAIEGSA